MKTVLSKKLMSIFLAVVLLFSMAPTFTLNAFATDTTENKTSRTTAVSSDMTLLYKKLVEYENLISTGKIYTNMASAYKVYMNACKIYNASMPNECNQGLLNAESQLTTAINSMKEWDGVTISPTSSPSFTADTSGYDMSNNYVNYIWGESGTSESRGSKSLDKHTIDLYYPKTVLYYDGVTAPKTGVMSIGKGTNNSAVRYLAYATIQNSDISIEDYWHGSTNEDGAKTLDYTWNYNQSEVLSANSSVNSKFYVITSSSGFLGTTSYTNRTRAVSNVMTFNGSFGKDEYYKAYYPEVYYAGGATGDIEEKQSASVTGNTAIYVINYKALVDAIQNNSLNVDAYDYQRGGLENLFDFIEELTTFSFNDYNYSDNYDNAVVQCAEKIKYFCDGLNDLDSLIDYSDSETLDPTADLESNGDAVHMGGVIYTHASGDNSQYYSMYGQEIADNYLYNQAGSANGERYTKVSVDFPNYLDLSDPYTIYCLSDSDVVKQGYSYGDIRAKALYDGKWVDEEYNTYDTDDDAAEAVNDGHYVTKEYYLVGNVSDYFHYDESTGEYTQTGVSLAVTYKDIDGYKYGEYQFLYVMPNPAWAHEIVGIRNQYKDDLTTKDVRLGALYFTRFDDSFGSASDSISTLINGDSGSFDIKTSEFTYPQGGANGSSSSSSSLGFARGTGNFPWISSFGNTASLSTDYSSPSNTAKIFNFYETNEGSNAGAYYVVEHYDEDTRSYASASNVVNVDYYIDYSDTTNSHITYDNGVPTGYQIKLYASNLKWDSEISEDYSIGATSAEDNRTGLETTYESTESGDHIYESNTHAKRSSRSLNATSDTSNWLLYGLGDDYTDFKSRFTATGSLKGFPTLSNGFGVNGLWNGTVTFTGKDTLKKNTDTSSAESYANYILEFGNYSAVRNLISDDDYLYGNETYHYYNIGVATCDKGAVREFVDTFCNNQMTIDYDDDGRVIGIESDYAIESANYTVSSYNEYLDAIAQAYWFVENPANTSYYTDKDGNVIDDDDLDNYNLDELTEHDYSTAYGTVEDGTEKHALIYSDEEGDDIFGESGAYTDPVQAKIIQDIIEAYDNLFTKQDFIDAKELYDNATTLVKNLDTKGYTSTSIKVWNDFASSIGECFDYYLDESSKTSDTEQYWRKVELSGSEYKELEEAISELENSLMPVVDTTLISENISTKTDTLKSGILDSSGEQIYSYSSWANLSSEIATAKSYVTAAGTKDDDGFLPGKYAVTGTSEYTYNGVTYTYETFDEDDNKLSEIQKTIYDYNDSNALQNATLTSIDDSEAYESFDDAINILDSLDKRKYTDEGIAKIEELRASLIGSEGSVYKELTDKEKEAYKTATGNDITLDSIKVTAQKETDPKTADILNSITDLNNIDNGFVKEFTAELTVQDENRNVISTSTDTAYYGNKFNFDLGDDVDDDSSIVWSVSLYDDVTKRNDDDSIKSLKDYANVTASSKWAYPGKTISRIADSNVSITAMVTGASESTDDTVKVEIYNIYNRLVGIVYTKDTVTAGTGDNKSILYNGSSEIFTADDVPFYKFVSWNIPNSATDGVLKVTAKYAPVGTYSITVDGGTLNNSDSTSVVANYDDSITVAVSDDTQDFWAWAVKKGDKYQIASYSSNYTFYACTDEDFVPVIAKTVDGNTTYTVNDVALSSSNVDSTFTLDTSTDIVQEKLANKYPFIALQDARFSDSNTKVTAFVRITQGGKEPTGYGILYRPGTTTKSETMVIDGTNVRNVPINNKLSTGQFVVSLNSKSAITTNVTFRAYINYDYQYSFDGTNTDKNSASTNANALDYSNFINATPIS